MAKRKISDATVYAILYILLGVLFVVFKSSMLNWLLTIAGIALIALGVFDIVRKNLYTGIIEAIVGIVLIVGGWVFVEIVLIVLGAALIVKGAVALVGLIQVHSKNAMAIISQILTIVVGVLLIVSKWVMLDWFFIVLGVICIVDGFFALIQKN